MVGIPGFPLLFAIIRTRIHPFLYKRDMVYETRFFFSSFFSPEGGLTQLFDELKNRSPPSFDGALFFSPSDWERYFRAELPSFHIIIDRRKNVMTCTLSFFVSFFFALRSCFLFFSVI